MKKIFALLMVATAFMACGEQTAKEQPKEKSEVIIEAEATHEKMLQVKGEVLQKLHDTIEGHEKRIEMYASDPERADFVQELTERLAKLEALHDEIHEWEHNIVEIPGHAHTHDHDDHGHDHNHDHAQDRVLEGLSDQEHLDIQRELYNQIREFNARLTTITRN